jgi:hypothetical protein
MEVAHGPRSLPTLWENVSKLRKHRKSHSDTPPGTPTVTPPKGHFQTVDTLGQFPCSIRHLLSGIPVPQHSFPQNCGKDLSHPKNLSPKIPSRKIAGRISLTKVNAPKIPSRNFEGRIFSCAKIISPSTISSPKFLPAIRYPRIPQRPSTVIGIPFLYISLTLYLP